MMGLECGGLGFVLSAVAIVISVGSIIITRRLRARYQQLLRDYRAGLPVPEMDAFKGL